MLENKRSQIGDDIRFAKVFLSLVREYEFDRCRRLVLDERNPLFENIDDCRSVLVVDGVCPAITRALVGECNEVASVSVK